MIKRIRIRIRIKMKRAANNPFLTHEDLTLGHFSLPNSLPFFLSKNNVDLY